MKICLTSLNCTFSGEGLMHWTQLISTEMYVYVQLIAPYKLNNLHPLMIVDSSNFIIGNSYHWGIEIHL